jgi:hypothetical protein
VTAGQPPPAAVLSFAMVHGAVYDAVNAIDRGHRAYLPQPRAPRTASKDAAAATAAYQVLAGLFPAQQPALQSLYEMSLAGVSDSPPDATADGIAAGAAAAGTMLAARKDDGRFPEYPSGHNCAAGAMLSSLRYFFHTDRVAFSASSNKNATTRSWHSISEALRENIDARVWAGIHFRQADVVGVALGKKVARYLHDRDLQPHF